MVSPPSKLKMFPGSVCVLLTSVSLILIKIRIKLIYPTTSSWEKKWRVKGKWRRLILFFFLWSELVRVQFYFIFIFYSIRVDPSWSDPDRRCQAKIFICPVPKISHVMMKWCCRASHLGRFTLWNNGRLATQLRRFTLWHNRRWASQMQLAGKFTLWLHNSVDLLCGTTDPELHNSPVNLLCDTTDAELNNPVWCMHQE